MKKYLVIADTFRGSYGCQITLFHIADSLEEAQKFIMDYDGDFDFFAHYTPERYIYVDPETGEPIHRTVPLRRRLSECKKKAVNVSREEYALKYIQVFYGEPATLGGYEE